MAYREATKRAVLRDLETVFKQRGTVPAALVRECARDVGCAERTVWNWWTEHQQANGEQRKPRDPRQLTETQIEVLFATQGNVSRAHKLLSDDPETCDSTPPRRTLAYLWDQQDVGYRSFAKDGGSALLDKQMRVRHTVEERNQLWRVDHQEFPVWLLPGGRSTTPFKPWITTIIDDCTRYLMALLITGEPATATTVGVALADAVRLKPTTIPGVEVGGVPQALASDNGGEFRSAQYTTMLRELGIASKRTYPYMKHLNGKAERVQQTMQQELGQLIPGYAQGPKTLKLKDLFGLDADVLGEELFTEIALNWANTYNVERAHDELGGRAPLLAWSEQQTPLREADPETVRLAMMPTSSKRKVTPDGISLSNQLYTSGELAALRIVDRMVDVRFLPHDDSFIEVFDGDRWLCTAVKVHRVNETGRALMSAVHKEQYATARAYHVAARERRQEAVATATVDNPKMGRITAPRASSLLDGDEQLLELSEGRGAYTDAAVDAAVDPAAPVEVGSTGTDPWELDPSVEDDLDVIDDPDLEGAPR